MGVLRVLLPSVHRIHDRVRDPVVDSAQSRGVVVASGPSAHKLSPTLDSSLFKKRIGHVASYDMSSQLVMWTC